MYIFMYCAFKMNLYVILVIQIAFCSADLLKTNTDNERTQVEKATAKRIISRIFVPRHKLDSQKNRNSRILDLIRNRLHKKVAVTSNDNFNDLSSEVHPKTNLQNSILKLLARRNEDNSNEISSPKHETELNADILSSLLENINVSNINSDGNKIRKGKLIIYYDGDNQKNEVRLDNLSDINESPDDERVKMIDAEILDLYNKLNISLDIYNSVLEETGDVIGDDHFNALLRALYKNGLYDGVDPRILKRELSALMVKHNIIPSEDLYWFTPVARSGDIDIYDDSDRSIDIEDIINNILGKKPSSTENKPNDILVIPVNNDNTEDAIDNGDGKNASNEDLLNIILSQGDRPQSSSELRDGNQDLSVSRTGSIKGLILSKPKGADIKLSSSEKEIPDIAVVTDKNANPLNILDQLQAASKSGNYNIMHKHKYNEHTVSSDIQNLIQGGSNEDGILNDLLNKIINDSSSEDGNGNELEKVDNSGFYSSDLSSLKHLINLALKEPLLNRHRRILSNKPINNVHNIRGKPFLIYVVFPHTHHKRPRADNDVDLLEKIKSVLSFVDDDDILLQKIKDLLRSGPEDVVDSQENENDNQVKNKIDLILQQLLDRNKKQQSQDRKEQSLWEIIQQLDPNFNNNKQESKRRPDKEKLMNIILQWLAEKKRNKNESRENLNEDESTQDNLQSIDDVIALITGNQNNGQKQPIEDVYDQFKEAGLTWLIELIEQLKNHKNKPKQENDIDNQTDKLIKNIIRIIRALKANNVPGRKIRVIIERLIQKGLVDISGRSVSACTKKINEELIRGIQNALAKYAQ